MDLSSMNNVGAGAAASMQSSQLQRLEQAGEGDATFAAKEMERLFAQMLVKELRSDLSKGIFGSGPGADTYSAWFDEHLGTELADSGVLDLAGRIRVALDGQETNR